tara:strand:- start:629 stop:940 length:312 start_codon:yes stop_codon:yes gene_type:complete
MTLKKIKISEKNSVIQSREERKNDSPSNCNAYEKRFFSNPVCQRVAANTNELNNANDVSKHRGAAHGLHGEGLWNERARIGVKLRAACIELAALCVDAERFHY